MGVGLYQRLQAVVFSLAGKTRNKSGLGIATILIAMFCGSKAPADIHSNLIGDWPCQDNAASTVVVGTVGGNATLQGGDNTEDIDTTGPNATYPSALLFDGTADWVQAPNIQISDSASPSTVSMWIKRSSTNARVVLSMHNFSSAGGSLHWYLANTTTFNVKLGSDINFTITALGTDWHHVAVTADGSKDVRLYIDGAQVGSEQEDASIGNIYLRGFGARNSPDLFFDGAICGVRVYDRALSDADITELFEWDGSFPEVESGNQRIIIIQ